MCGKYLMCIVAALVSVSWTASMIVSAFEFTRNANKSTGEEPPIQMKGGLGESLKSFISGAFGGVCVVLVGHPLDLIKVSSHKLGRMIMKV
jgi:ABC-type Fe3+ transport system permease subunit